MIVLEVLKPEIDDVDLVEEQVLDVEVVEDDVVHFVVKRNGNVELAVWLILHQVSTIIISPSYNYPALNPPAILQSRRWVPEQFLRNHTRPRILVEHAAVAGNSWAGILNTGSIYTIRDHVFNRIRFLQAQIQSPTTSGTPTRSRLSWYDRSR